MHPGAVPTVLCLEIGVPLEEVIAFGDGDNDIEFLELAGKGIAMKNARDTLKAVADEITEWTNDKVS
jgi:hydroxymethylpyrimidine pyrophosphatase-like HAD family hydrolase